ncbi:MAG: ATP synthase subunit I [Steroidobacteraceae bacterium]
MPMNDVVTSQVLPMVAGLLLGVVFYGGLWWTVRSSLASRRPAQWFILSLLARTGVAMLGFYFVGQGHWERLLLCLLGFVAARLIVTRLAGSPGAKTAGAADHAS